MYFLGVDGGQSSTSAVIGDATGAVLGYGRGGPCNHVKGPGGREKFINAIQGCVGQACLAAGLSTSQVEFEAACLGFSGGPTDKEDLLNEILRVKKRVVTNDALIALSGAHGGQPGVITIAGTGSISFARNAAGKTFRAGGWGYKFGDEGGAFDIVRNALRAALRMEEGWGEPTMLLAMLTGAVGAANANDLLHRFYTEDYPRPRIASFARLVDDAAQQGDKVAQSILTDAARELAAITEASRNQAFAQDAGVRVACIGGVFRSHSVLTAFSELVEAAGRDLVVEPLYGPATGALLDAYRAADIRVPITGAPPEKG